MTWYHDYIDWILYGESGDIVNRVAITGLLILFVPFIIHWIIFKSPAWFRARPAWFRMQKRLRNERKRIEKLEKLFGSIPDDVYDEKLSTLLNEIEENDPEVYLNIMRQMQREHFDEVRETAILAEKLKKRKKKLEKKINSSEKRDD